MPATPRDEVLVSVVIPAWNAGSTLAQTLRSVLAQTHPLLDIVVVDDGSADDTARVAGSFGERVRVLRQPNAGIARARNAGLQAARGEYIALLDADDICEPERIAVQLEYLLRNPQLLLCSSDFSAFDQLGRVATSYGGVYYKRCAPEHGGVLARFPECGELDIGDCVAGPAAGPLFVRTLQGDIYEQLALGNFLHPPTVMLRRQALRLAGGFDPEVRIVCEWEWFVRVARIGPIGYIDRPLLRYRCSTEQISASPATVVDSLRVARLILQRDPQLRRRAPGAIRRHLGALSLSAAYALAETRRSMALRLLLAGTLRYRMVTRLSLATLARLTVPSALLRLARLRRQRRQALARD